MIYFVILFLFVAIAIRCDGRRHSYYNVYVFNGIVLICLAGFRNFVGGDTIGYMREYEFFPTIQNLTLADFVLSRYGLGWILFWSLCKTISSEFWVFQMIHALIVNITILWFIKKYCPKYKFTVLLIYYFLFFFRENMEVLREAIATSLFLIGYTHLAYNKLKGNLIYTAIILLATLFHKYAAIWLLLPLLIPFLRKHIDIRRLISVVIIMFLIIYTPLKEIFVLANIIKPESLHKYLEIYTYQNWVGIAYSGVFCILYYSLLKRCERYHIMPEPVLIGMRLFVYMNFMGLAFPIFSTRLINYINIIFYIALVYGLYRLPIKMRSFKLIFAFLICFNRIWGMLSDVTSWTYDYNTTQKYYYYERYIPYYSIWEKVPSNDYWHRYNIAAQERKNDNEKNE